MLFNEELYRDSKDLLDFENSSFTTRKAVRAIIRNKGKILLVFLEKTKEYKFPGGGVEENESDEQALIREVLEEAGYVVSRINEKTGSVTEYGIDKYDSEKIFKMTSNYYSADIEDRQLSQNLSKYEKEPIFRPCWTEIETAYRVNKELIETGRQVTPWIRRETRVLEILKE